MALCIERCIFMKTLSARLQEVEHLIDCVRSAPPNARIATQVAEIRANVRELYQQAITASQHAEIAQIAAYEHHIKQIRPSIAQRLVGRLKSSFGVNSAIKAGLRRLSG